MADSTLNNLLTPPSSTGANGMSLADLTSLDEQMNALTSTDPSAASGGLNFTVSDGAQYNWMPAAGTETIQGYNGDQTVNTGSGEGYWSNALAGGSNNALENTSAPTADYNAQGGYLGTTAADSSMAPAAMVASVLGAGALSGAGGAAASGAGGGTAATGAGTGVTAGAGATAAGAGGGGAGGLLGSGITAGQALSGTSALSGLLGSALGGSGTSGLLGSAGGLIAGGLTASALNNGNASAQTAANTANPFQSQYAGYQQQLQGLMTNPNSFQQSAESQALTQQGMAQTNAQMGASGLFNSGAQEAALTNLATTNAGTNYNSQITQLEQLSGANTSSPATAGQILQNQNTANSKSAAAAGSAVGGLVGNAVGTGLNGLLNSGASSGLSGANTATGVGTSVIPQGSGAVSGDNTGMDSSLNSLLGF